MKRVPASQRTAEYSRMVYIDQHGGTFGSVMLLQERQHVHAQHVGARTGQCRVSTFSVPE